MLCMNYTNYDIINCLCSPVNVGEDCPVFDGMYEFCQLSAGGSIGNILLAVLYINTALNFMLFYFDYSM